MAWSYRIIGTLQQTLIQQRIARSHHGLRADGTPYMNNGIAFVHCLRHYVQLAALERNSPAQSVQTLGHMVNLI
ncbi:hypothetical protein D3C80_1530380 [compost metagenome]